VFIIIIVAVIDHDHDYDDDIVIFSYFIGIATLINLCNFKSTIYRLLALYVSAELFPTFC